MSAKFVREFTFPDDLVARIDRVLQSRFGLRITDAKEIARSVQKMSDYYIENPAATTPWTERWCQIAQLAYYFPLNALRLQAVLQEGRRFGFFENLRQVTDFGAGLGPLAWALNETGINAPVEFIERSADALKLARDLDLKFESTNRLNGSPTSLLAFSYSFTELDKLPPAAHDFGALLILEPSTRQDGRRLLEVRRGLIQQGYSMWAPCPHQEGCPLLEKSPADWCHDRIHFNRPDWWLKIEKHLPFENPTLTFSYLLASRRPSPVPARTVRIVGDLLKEKGKSRQLVCRGPDREFFAWLHRGGREIPEWPRGALMLDPQATRAGNELRPQEDLRPWQTC